MGAKVLLLSSILAISLVVVGCGGDPTAAIPQARPGQVVKLDSREGKALLKSDRHALLIDTRTVPEYIRGHLVGAQSVDMSDAEAWKFRVAEFDLNRPTVVYCRDDKCSREAAERLVSAGLTHVYDLGSPNDWDRRYLPLDGRRSGI